MSQQRAFLVTGATGAVGSAIVPLLLSEPGTRVHVLLRAVTDDELRARVQSLAKHWGDDVSPAALAERLAPVRGDVLLPKLGMDAGQHDLLASEVTHIVHSAGNVKLNQSIEAARASAVSGVESMLDFVRECGKARSRPKLEYLSTVGVAGRQPGLIPEAPLAGAHGYHNTYEQAKAEAEALVLREMASGLPATIHRPSMVVGNADDGRILHFQVFYHLARFLAGARTRGILPKFGEARLDLVPVDYVSRAIVASSRRDGAAGRILHLCSGPLNSALLCGLANTLRDFLHERGEKVYPLRFVPRGMLRGGVRLASWLAPMRLRRTFETLPYFLDYLDESQVFANERTDAFLRQEGIASPVLSDFLPPVLEYWYRRQPPAAG